jgi:hypothetical protein
MPDSGCPTVNYHPWYGAPKCDTYRRKRPWGAVGVNGGQKEQANRGWHTGPMGGWPIGRPSWHLEMLFVGRAAPVVRHIFAISTMYIPHHSSSFLIIPHHSSSFLIIPVQLSSCSQFGACQRGAGWPALGLGVSSKKSPLGQSPAGAKYTRHFRTPPYGHDGSLRFVTVFAHNGAVPVRSQVIHNFQEHPLLFGRRRAFRKGFPPTGPSSTDRRR